MEKTYKTAALLKSLFDPKKPKGLKEHQDSCPDGPGLMVHVDMGPITANLSFIGTITTRMLTGSINLVHLRVPSVMCYPEPYLHMWSQSFLMQPKYMKLASKTTDPVERLKLITTGFISDLHESIILSKGQPPIMSFPGQSLQGTNEYGAKFTMNMLSCKPTETQAEIRITDSDDDFIFTASQNYVINMNGMTINSLRMTDSSVYHINFKDGSKYSVTLPRVKIYGTLSSDRKFIWKNKKKNKKIKNDILQLASVTDHTNNLKCTMDFGKNPEKGNGIWSGMFGKAKVWNIYNKNEVKLRIFDCKNEDKMKELGTGTANLLGFVAFEDKVYWNVNDAKPKWVYSDNIRPLTAQGEQGQPKEGEKVDGGLFDLGYVQLAKDKKHEEADAWIKRLDTTYGEVVIKNSF